jgi:purine-binding chemotaxis protein CheW
MTSNTEVKRAEAGKYLTFLLQKEDYGVPIMIVREIIAMHVITPLPRLPDHVKGVINLRGRNIPVIDLRLRLSMPQAEYDKHTCIIVIDANWAGEEEHAPIGCIVDTVNEVLYVDANHIEPTPSFGPGIDTSIALGVVKHPARGSVLTLLDIQRVLGQVDISLPASLAA